jgi:hypothetical protein
VLTKQHLRKLGNTSESGTVMLNQLMMIIGDILSLAGFEVKRHNSSEDTSHLDDRIRQILVRSFELRDTIGEHVTSCDYRILAPEPNKPFDTEEMEDAYMDRESDSTKKNGTVSVLCCTELGLNSFEKLQGANASESNRVRCTVNLKAKVVTEAALHDLLSEDETQSAGECIFFQHNALVTDKILRLSWTSLSTHGVLQDIQLTSNQGKD